MPILDKKDVIQVKKYNEFIKNSSYGHLMQDTRWSQVKKNWENDHIYLTDETGEIRAALSVLSIKNDGVNAFMYAPRGPVCDFHDTDTVTELINEAQKVAEKRNAFLLRMDPEFLYDENLVKTYRELGYSFRSRGENEHSFSNPRYHMLLNVKDQTVDEVMSRFKGRVRSKVRKTYRDNLWTRTFTVSDENYKEALDRFYDLTEKMAERQGITYRPKDYFDRLMHAYSDIKIYETLDEENEVLSSAILVSYNRKSFYMYGASSNNKRKLNASYQTQMEMIKHAIERGRENYDFGGVFSLDSDDGLYRFKSGFCNEDGASEFIGELDVVYSETEYQKFLKNEQKD